MEITINIPAYEYLGALKKTLTVDTLPANLKIEIFDDSESSAVMDFATSPTGRIHYSKGSRTGNPVDNWNKGLDSVESGHIITMHHDEYIKEYKPHSQSLTLDSSTVYVFEHLIRGNVRISARVKCFLIETFPRLVLYANFIGPTACLAVPSDCPTRFDANLRWLVDANYYLMLSRQYRFRPFPNLTVATDDDFKNTITSRIRGKLSLAQEELRTLGETGSLLRILASKILVKLITVAPIK